MQKSQEIIAAEWPQFTEKVRARLDVGAVEYGDVSFDRPAAELVAEIKQELYDVTGWGFILFTKLQRIEALLAKIETAQSA